MSETPSGYEAPRKRWISRRNLLPEKPLELSAFEAQKIRDSAKFVQDQVSSASSTWDSIIEEIKDAVNAIPSEGLVQYEICDTPDVMEAEVTAVTGINDLIALASIGGEDAITALVRIGNSVAEALEALTAGKNETPARFLPMYPSNAEIMAARRHSPPISIAFHGSLESVEKVVTSRISEIKSLGSAIQWNGLPMIGEHPVGVTVTVGRFRFSENFQFSRIYPEECREEEKAAVARYERRSKAEKTLPQFLQIDCLPDHDRASMAISDLVNTLVGNRIHELFRAHVQNQILYVAKSSFTWPNRISVVPHMTRILNNYQDFLALGSSLPFHIHREAHEPGNRPPFSPESNAGFTLLLLMPVFRQWECFQTCTPNERKAVKYRADKFQKLLEDSKKKATRGSKGIDLDQQFKVELAGHSYYYSPRDIWALNAILLPAFPAADGTTSAMSALKKWKDVALQLAAYQCAEDWSNHSWPACVKNKVKSGKSGERARKAREAVGTAIMAGLKVLQRPPSTA